MRAQRRPTEIFREMKAPRTDHIRVKQELVYQVKGKGNSNPKVTCYWCGLRGHVEMIADTKRRSVVLAERKDIWNKANQAPARKQKGEKPFRQAKVEQEDSSSESDEWAGTINKVGKWPGQVSPIKVPLTVDSQSIEMVVDTGASVSLISKNLFDKRWPGRRVEPSKVRLRNYSNELIPVVGTVEVRVSYEGQEATLPLIVVEGDGSTLHGRNWLRSIRLNWATIHAVLSTGLKEDVVSRYDDVFQPGLGNYKGFHV